MQSSASDLLGELVVFGVKAFPMDHRHTNTNTGRFAQKPSVGQTYPYTVTESYPHTNTAANI